MANVQVQHPRQFTLRIRHAISGETVGTGFVISDSGLMVTCAHVVEAAAGSINLDVVVGAYFQPSKQEWLAKVVKYFENYDDDVVLL